MKSLVLEKVGKLSLRDFPLKETLGPHDVRVKILACGICGSDIHYYKEGAIGEFVVQEPMILGHEAAGMVVEKGSSVQHLNIGDVVCMEPGVPTAESPEVLEGNYHLDPDLTFWATPPVHGVLRESVVHPARFCFKLPKVMSAEEGAMIEPLAIGIESAKRAAITPGDVGLVIGAGTIGIMIALSALASGCSKVFVADVKQEKLDIIGRYPNIIPINSQHENMLERVLRETEGRGADRVWEASGSIHVYPDFFRCAKRGSTVVLVGMMNEMAPINIPLLQGRGVRIETVFRYTNAFDKAVALVSSGSIDVKPLISKTFPFEQAIEAFDFAAQGKADVIKVVITM